MKAFAYRSQWRCHFGLRLTQTLVSWSHRCRFFENMLGAELQNTERIFPAIAKEALGTSTYAVHENVVVAGASIPLHAHAVEEVIVCLVGSADCSFNGGVAEPYGAGSVVIIPANAPHAIRNRGTGELRQISFFAGAKPRTCWIEGPGSVS